MKTRQPVEPPKTHRPRRPLTDRFWDKVQKTETCWLWTANVDRGGYGRIAAWGSRNALAHRVSYWLANGDLPEMPLDHLCRVRHCVRPDHLEPVTTAENNHRGEPPSRTHCPAGHEYTPENTRYRGRSRHCRTCHRRHQANYLARKAAADVA